MSLHLQTQEEDLSLCVSPSTWQYLLPGFTLPLDTKFLCRLISAPCPPNRVADFRKPISYPLPCRDPPPFIQSRRPLSLIKGSQSLFLPTPQTFLRGIGFSFTAPAKDSVDTVVFFSLWLHPHPQADFTFRPPLLHTSQGSAGAMVSTDCWSNGCDVNFYSFLFSSLSPVFLSFI